MMRARFTVVAATLVIKVTVNGSVRPFERVSLTAWHHDEIVERTVGEFLGSESEAYPWFDFGTCGVECELERSTSLADVNFGRFAVDFLDTLEIDSFVVQPAEFEWDLVDMKSA